MGENTRAESHRKSCTHVFGASLQGVFDRFNCLFVAARDSLTEHKAVSVVCIYVHVFLLDPRTENNEKLVKITIQGK